MATVDSAKAVNTQTIYQQNPYLAMSQTSMANDFFGSQIFGSTPLSHTRIGNNNLSANELGEGSGSLASMILQNYYASKSGLTASTAQNGLNPGAMKTPTVKDYYMASQIAGMFASNTPLINPNTSFFEKDIFAKQMINPAVKQNLSYQA